MDQAEDVSYDAIPIGPYNAVCEAAEYEVALSGKPMISAVFVVTDGPYKGRKVWNRFVLVTDSDASLGHFFRHMNVFGMDKAYINALAAPQAGGMTTMAGVMVGRACTIHVKIKPYEGEDRNEIGNFTPVGSAAPAAVGVPQGIPVPATDLGGLPASPAPAPPVAAPAAPPVAAPPVAAPPATPTAPVAAPPVAPVPAVAPPVVEPTPAEQAAIEVPVPTPAPGMIQPPQGNPATPF